MHVEYETVVDRRLAVGAREEPLRMRVVRGLLRLAQIEPTDHANAARVREPNDVAKQIAAGRQERAGVVERHLRRVLRDDAAHVQQERVRAELGDSGDERGRVHRRVGLAEVRLQEPDRLGHPPADVGPGLRRRRAHQKNVRIATTTSPGDGQTSNVAFCADHRKPASHVGPMGASGLGTTGGSCRHQLMSFSRRRRLEALTIGTEDHRTIGPRPQKSAYRSESSRSEEGVEEPDGRSRAVARLARPGPASHADAPCTESPRRAVTARRTASTRRHGG